MAGHSVIRQLSDQQEELNESYCELQKAKFTRQGPVGLDVHFAEQDLVVAVSDTGVGIPVQRQRDVFQLFTQLDDGSTPAHRGAGIGLTLVQRQVQAMGGYA